MHEVQSFALPRGLHFHGNQAGGKERISACNGSVLRNKAECRPRASSGFSLRNPATSLTLDRGRSACSLPPPAAEAVSASHGWLLEARKAALTSKGLAHCRLPRALLLDHLKLAFPGCKTQNRANISDLFIISNERPRLLKAEHVVSRALTSWGNTLANKTSLLTVTSNGHLSNVHGSLAMGKQECFLLRNQPTSGPGEEILTVSTLRAS